MLAEVVTLLARQEAWRTPASNRGPVTVEQLTCIARQAKCQLVCL